MFEELASVAAETTNDSARGDGLIRSLIICTSLCSTLGAKEFSVAVTPGNGIASRLVPVLDSSFPGLSPTTRELCDKHSMAAAEHVIDGFAPVLWRGPDEPRDEPDLIRSAPTGPVSRRALAFPLRTDRGRRGIAVFVGSAISCDTDAICKVHARLFEIFPRLCESRPERRSHTALSQREHECLTMTAAGMTSDDIATALGLSVHTANQYIQTTIQKLNAVNRMHAVAKALRLGLIA